MDKVCLDVGLRHICEEIAQSVDEVSEKSIQHYMIERKISAELICRHYFPFRNGRLLSATMILRILLLKEKKAVLCAINRGNKAFSEVELRNMYAKLAADTSWVLTEQEILFLSSAEIFSVFSYGIISPLFETKEVELYLGSCALIGNNHDICQCGIGYDGSKIIFPEFLRFGSKEEMIRIIRLIMLRERRLEFTGQVPEFEDDEIYAIRPPQGEWGMQRYVKGNKNGENNSIL